VVGILIMFYDYMQLLYEEASPFTPNNRTAPYASCFAEEDI
jgi:hypothetical protein